jgi:hypothetical protein
VRRSLLPQELRGSPRDTAPSVTECPSEAAFHGHGSPSSEKLGLLRCSWKTDLRERRPRSPLAPASRGRGDSAPGPDVAPPPSDPGRLVSEVGRRSGSCPGARRLVIDGNGSRSLRLPRIRSRTHRLRDTAGHVEGRTSLDPGLRLGPKWDQLGPLMFGDGPRRPPWKSDEVAVGVRDVKRCPQRDSNPCCRLERSTANL